MSYARWSNSCWYAFYNANGKLSLWYDMDHTFDWDYDDLIECMEYAEMKTVLIERYGCTEPEADEALKYINYFIEDYEDES
jgi:hypothetical protein